MEVKNCRKCGKLFNYMGGLMTCPACKAKLEEKFLEVKEYIRENTHVGLMTVAEVCEVDSNQIKQWIREERLELASDSAIKFNCEKCNAPITSGRYCDKCKKNMADNLSHSIKKPAPQIKEDKPVREKSRMRFLDNN